MLSLAPSYNGALGENIPITIYSPVVSFTRGRGSSPGTCPCCVSIHGAQTPHLSYLVLQTHSLTLDRVLNLGSCW